MPSEIDPSIETICTIYGNGGCINKIKKQSIDTIKKNLDIIYELSNKQILVKPIGLYYESIDKDNMVEIIGIMTINQNLIPINNISIPKEELDNLNITYKTSPINYSIDTKLISYNKNNVGFIDERIKAVNNSKFKNEGYQLFKYELSNIINTNEYKNAKKDIKKLIETENISELINYITSFITKNNLFEITKNNPNIDYYKIKNKREQCSNLNESKCVSNLHCHFSPSTKNSKIKC